MTPDDDDRLRRAWTDGDTNTERPLDDDERAELSELRDLEARLQDAGRELRADLDHADGLESAPGEQDVEAIVARLAGAESESPPPAATTPPVRSIARPLWAVAAAVLILALTLAFRDREPSDIPLGEGAFELHAPVGVERFTWDATRSEFGWYRVLIRSAPGAPVIVESDRLTETTWRPDEAERAQIPTEYYWEVEIREPGMLVDAKGQSARRGE